MKSLMSAFLVVLGMSLLWSSSAQPVQPPAQPTPVLTRAVGLDDAPAPPPDREWESAEGLPVPIYPGTRVDEAEIGPPRPGLPGAVGLKDSRGLHTKMRQLPGSATVAGRLSATEPRARADARVQLQREVADWLAPDVPASWKAPAGLIDRLVVRTRIKPIVKDYGTLYEATLDVDLSPLRRDEIVAAYRHELVGHRLISLAGGLGFVLTCLAALAGYIRADEATKGYYTHWLRAVAAAGVGASGVLIYQLLT
jgi:hypothetical protein